MNVNLKDLVITSLETIDVFEAAGKQNYLFTLDELQNATISQSEETTDITGKGGRRLSTLKRNKSITISGTNGMVSGGLLEQQTGGTFTYDDEAVVRWTDYLVAETAAGGSAPTATTTHIAIGTAGEEIKALYLKDRNGNATELVQDSAAAAGKFAYNPSTNLLTFNTDVADGTEVVVIYDREVAGNVLENRNDVYAKKAAVYINAIAEDKCANVYRVQFYFPKADFSGEFSFEMGDNQTVHAFEAEALGGACGIGGQVWTYTVFMDETEDEEDDG